MEIFSTHETLVAGHPYTIVLSHSLGSLQEHTYADQDIPAPSGSMQVRVVNAVEYGSALAIYVTSATTPDAPAVKMLSLSEGEASAYLDLPAGPTYMIAAAAAGGPVAHTLKVVPVKAVSGAVRTVVFAGVGHPGAYPVVGFTLTDADAD